MRDLRHTTSGLRAWRQTSPAVANALVVVAVAVLLLCAIVAQRRLSAQASPIDGTYTVQFGGAARGLGQARVAGKNVTITGNLIDGGGNPVSFSAGGLKLTGTRFKGTGSVGADAISISGRIDPADTTSPKPRLQATYLGNGEAGRTVGLHD
jgi:hypothetical protein